MKVPLQPTAVILIGVRRNGPEEVAVSDPLFRDGEPFFLTRAELERAWRGAALVTTPLLPGKAETSFGFSWFTTKLFAERVMPKLRHLWPEWKDDHRWWIKPMANRLQPENTREAAEVAR